MKYTTPQTNMLFLASVLAILQVFIIIIMNGELAELIKSDSKNDLLTLGTIFSPTGGIVWALKRSVDYRKE